MRTRKCWTFLHLPVLLRRLEVSWCPSCAKDISWKRKNPPKESTTLVFPSLICIQFFFFFGVSFSLHNTTCIAMINSLIPKNPCRLESAIAQTLDHKKCRPNKQISARWSTSLCWFHHLIERVMFFIFSQ